jgi:hypothetical protein
MMDALGSVLVPRGGYLTPVDSDAPARQWPDFGRHPTTEPGHSLGSELPKSRRPSVGYRDSLQKELARLDADLVVFLWHEEEQRARCAERTDGLPSYQRYEL